MDKDRVEGKVKDIAGRVQRQVGEWTGDTKDQAEGAAKQVEGKVQNAWGKAKDAVKKPSTSETTETDEEEKEVGSGIARPTSKLAISATDCTDQHDWSASVSIRGFTLLLACLRSSHVRPVPHLIRPARNQTGPGLLL